LLGSAPVAQQHVARFIRLWLCQDCFESRRLSARRIFRVTKRFFSRFASSRNVYLELRGKDICRRLHRSRAFLCKILLYHLTYFGYDPDRQRWLYLRTLLFCVAGTVDVFRSPRYSTGNRAAFFEGSIIRLQRKVLVHTYFFDSRCSLV